ncbi:MAG: DEAD/DEAH box helicase [Cetobacterium sp.]|uniref:DEAD/DEAH box helicase n=1 Tax=Cetobacterium sp. TaxID=2071632 RepID=UPI003F399C6D
MEIVRSNYLEVIPANSYEYSVIKQIITRGCTRDNPVYLKAKKANRFVKGLARTIVTFKEQKDKFLIYKANYNILKELENCNLPVKYTDKRVSNKIEVYPTKGPRDNEQKNAIATLYDWFTEGFGYGCLNAAPAAGKTFMAINLVSKLKEKTLVVVDMKLLIEQFVDSITFFSDIKHEEIGFVSESKVDIKDKKIIIATAQTLIKKPEVMNELASEIGFLIVDEVHVASSNTFQKIIPRFRPMYQLGLSGSHNRDDKMEFLIQESVGPIVSTIEREDLIRAGSIMTPILRPVFLKDDEKFEKYNVDRVNFRDVVENYYNCPKTILKISKFINHYHNQGRSQLLICKEKNMVNSYYDELLKLMLGEKFINECKKEINFDIENLKIELDDLDKKGLEYFATKKDLKLLADKKMSRKDFNEKYKEKKSKKIDIILKKLELLNKKTWKDSNLALQSDIFRSVEILTGEISSKERTRIIDETNSGKIRILITTTTVDKAVSINRLDTLHLLFSTRERANCIQRVGRVSRTFKNKPDAIVFDYIYDHYMSFYQFNNNSGECRMTVHRDFTKVHETNNLFIDFLKARYRDNFELDRYKKAEFEKIKKRYILEIS